MFDYHLHTSLLQKRPQYTSSVIKSEIATRLLARLDLVNISPKHILLVGYHDHEYKTLLQSRFPDSDICVTPSQPALYDLIISNTDIHLNENLHSAFELLAKSLTPNGILLFSSFAAQTMASFGKLWRRIDGSPHHNTMIDMHDWGDIIFKTSLETPVIESELLHFDYQDTHLMWQDIRALNEPLADTKMRKNFTGKYRWAHFCTLLEDNPRLTFEVVYGYAKLPNLAKGKKDQSGAINISFDALRKQLLGK